MDGPLVAGWICPLFRTILLLYPLPPPQHVPRSTLFVCAPLLRPPACACVQTEEWFTSTADLTKTLGEDAAGRPRYRITYARRGSLPASKVRPLHAMFFVRDAGAYVSYRICWSRGIWLLPSARLLTGLFVMVQVSLPT